MYRAGPKKRHAPIVNTSTTSDPTNPSKSTPRSVSCQRVSKWRLDNEYILTSYREEQATFLASLTYVHNETWNVYTHLAGAISLLLLYATVFLRYLAEPQFLDVLSMDYAMFEIYFGCAEIYLILSTVYHLLSAQSHQAERFWHGIDLSTWYCYCDCWYILFWHLLCVLLQIELTKTALGCC